MTQRCYIYGLAEPSGEIRYVGKTEHPSRRLGWHIRSARHKKNTHKDNWILLLISAGLRPEFVIIEIVHPWQDWQKREKFWIAHYRHLVGTRLTNTRDGGEGSVDFSGDVRERMSLAHKGKLKSEEHRKKIGDANRNPSAETRQRMSEWQFGVTGKKHSHRGHNSGPRKALGGTL